MSLVLAVGMCTALSSSARADAPATQPTPDPIGATGALGSDGTPSLQAPTYFLAGWPSGSGVDDGKGGLKSWTPYAATQPTSDEVTKNVSKAYYSINIMWTLVAGFLVMFMQAGFALVETGLCRAKNAAHTMFMNFFVYALGMFGFFVCGFTLMCSGVNGTAIGGPGNLGGLPQLDTMFKIGEYGIFGAKWSTLFLGPAAYDGATLVWFLFMMVFMDTTATIPTGALAERWATKHFILFSIAIGAITYPIYGCWVWGGGWLAQLGYLKGLGHGAVDYAGSGVVHLQGGALALITSIILGPRIGKYDKNGKPKTIAPHHVPMVLLGTFILAFGWFGFNAGSSLAATDGRIGVIAVNTMIAGTGATLVCVVLMYMFTGKTDPTMACNAILAGLVAITAPCAFVQPWSAFTIGAIAGGLVYGSCWFFERMGVDDPVGAISVHGVNGAWGVLALGLFADGTYGAGVNNVGPMAYMGVAGKGVTGLFYGDSGQFIAQVIDVVACVSWNVIAGGIIFVVLGFITPKRVPAAVEIAGLDIPEVGIAGYPEFLKPTLPEEIDTKAELELASAPA
jgi:Amt family ammonium transporter